MLLIPDRPPRKDSLSLKAEALSTFEPTSSTFLPIAGTKKRVTSFLALWSPERTQTSLASFAYERRRRSATEDSEE